MRWFEILAEDSVEDLKRKAAVLQREINTIENGKGLIDPDQLDDLDNDTYERKIRYLRAQRDSKSRQLVDKYHDLEILKSKIKMAAQKGKPSSIFTNYSSQKTRYQKQYMHDLGKLIDQADINLPDPAGEVISDFIGKKHSETNPTGIMMAKRLEDAFSSSPSEQGKLIRKQLEGAFHPVREALRAEFGDTIELYRAQQHYDGTEVRNVLSWTGDLEYAQIHHRDSNQGSGEILTREFSLNDIVWISDRAAQKEFIMLNHKTH